MSTILNALKKLEQEALAKDLAKDKDQKPSLKTKIRQDKSFLKSKKSRGLKKSKPLVWTVSLALLFLGSIALLLILPGRFQENRSTPEKEPGIKRAQAPPIEEREIPPEASSPTMDITPIQEIKISLPAEDHPKAPLSKREEATSVKIAKPIKEPPQIPIATRTRPDPVPVPGMPGEELPQTSIVTPADKPTKQINDRIDGKEKDKDKTVLQPDRTIELLEDGSLKVNAISWSKKSEDRLAVINSTIVREGQTVEGFRIVSIREEGVIVQRKGEKWLVKFGLR